MKKLETQKYTVSYWVNESQADCYVDYDETVEAKSSCEALRIVKKMYEPKGKDFKIYMTDKQKLESMIDLLDNIDTYESLKMTMLNFPPAPLVEHKVEIYNKIIDRLRNRYKLIKKSL